MAKSILLGLLLCGSAHAETFYFIGSKAVSAADATIAALSDNNLEVLKVQVNFTKVNKATVRLKKTRSAALSDIPR